MLTARQINVLFPNQAKQMLDNPIMKRRKTQRCLFGSPDPLETQRLLQEQLKIDRERMWRKWRIDVADGSASGGSLDALTTIVKQFVDREVLNRRRNEGTEADVSVRLADDERRDSGDSGSADRDTCRQDRHQLTRQNPYSRQGKMTDFYRGRRTSSSQQDSKATSLNTSTSQHSTV